MNYVSRKIFFSLVMGLLFSAKTISAPYYGFANMSVNYFDWTSNAEDSFEEDPSEINKGDFGYIELEGGSGYEWGTLYGFIDWENPFAKAPEEAKDNYKSSRFSAKGVATVKLGDSDWNFYNQLYSISGSGVANGKAGFSEQSLVSGISYDVVNTPTLVFSPFLGANWTQNSVGFADFNGGMFGWNFLYNFRLGNEKFSISNWNEFEFERKDDYLGYCTGTCQKKDDDGWVATNGKSYGINGAAAVWWHAIDAVTVGLQYRYAQYKLGDPKYIDGIIYTLKYNF